MFQAFNPYDTPAQLKQYLVYFNANFLGLTGAPDDIQTLANGVGIPYIPGDTTRENYTVDHSGNLVIIGPDGRQRGFIRAQTISFDDYIALGGEPTAEREADATWRIAIDDERRPGNVLETIALPAPLAHAGIATSTTLTRRWAQGRRHHVIDPRTGGMSTSPLVQATIVAGSACDAEVRATSALLQQPDAAIASLRSEPLDYLLFDAQRVWTSLEGATRG